MSNLKRRVEQLEQQSGAGKRHMRVFYPAGGYDAEGPPFQYEHDGRLWTPEELTAHLPEADTLMFIEYRRDWHELGGADLQ